MAQFFFGGFEILLLVVLGLLVITVVAVATRDDPDPTNRRPYGVYLFLATFVSLAVTLSGVYAVLQGLGNLAVDTGFGDVYPNDLREIPVQVDPGGFDSGVTQVEPIPFPDSSGRRAAARALVEGAIAVLAGLALLRFHGLRAVELADDPSYGDGVGRRTVSTYLYGVLFVLAFSLAGVGVAAARGLLGVMFGEELFYSSRDVGFRDFLVNALFWIVLAFVFRYHWRRAEALRTSLPPVPEPPPAPPPPPPAPDRRRPAPRKPGPKRRPA